MSSIGRWLWAMAPAVVAGCAAAPDYTIECGTPGGVVATGRALAAEAYGASMKPVPLNAVLFSASGIREQLVIQGLSSSRTASGTLAVNMTLANCLRTQQVIRVRTTFMDEGGGVADAPSAWRTVFLPPGGLATYQESSLGRERIKSYLVEIGAGTYK